MDFEDFENLSFRLTVGVRDNRYSLRLGEMKPINGLLDANLETSVTQLMADGDLEDITRRLQKRYCNPGVQQFSVSDVQMKSATCAIRFDVFRLIRSIMEARPFDFPRR